jgi:peptide deformylase
MAIREIIEIGDTRLKQDNITIEDVTTQLITDLLQDMKDTMYHRELIGIAAPQIAENYKIFITEPRQTEVRPADQADVLRVYINPEIVELADEEVIIYEGCGCIPKASIFGPVSRPKWVKIKATDENGKLFEFKADGILGRVILHEYDHLDGIEFIQKVKDNGQLMSFNNYVEKIKFQDWHKENSKITIKEFAYCNLNKQELSK